MFPFFVEYSNKIFPHLSCMDDLKKISDLTEPAYWYTAAREMKRKIIYHAGPTNSGKTYSAMQSFTNGESGVYCGPLKLLASEVFAKTNKGSTKCDLVTGEERKYANEDGTPSMHVACTVEMVNLDKKVDVAVIDEIQMIKDHQRGWAWTRAFLGLQAKEIHVCGDASSVKLISDLAFLVGDTFELRNYNRLTRLNYMSQALQSLSRVEPGDCFVCFNKSDIFYLRKNLEAMGHEVAIIYGSMPPGVKLAQASRFNDPEDKLKILIATDAIGMGLNLNIRRVIFYSIKKPAPPMIVDKSAAASSSSRMSSSSDTMELEYISTSQALQIAGRAGRFNTQFQDGFVTTFHAADLPILMKILNTPLKETVKAGLNPTSDQIELFAYHLPSHSLSSLMKIFTSLCTIDNSRYFMCNFEDTMYLAEMIDHIPLELKARYTFTLSPISRKNGFLCSFFVKFVRMYSKNERVSIDYLKDLLKWPFNVPTSNMEMAHLENVYDVFDLYLWLSYRFPNIFTDVQQVHECRNRLEEVIFEGVKLSSVKKSSDGHFLNDQKTSRSHHHRSRFPSLSTLNTSSNKSDTNKNNDTPSPSPSPSSSPPSPSSPSSSSLKGNNKKS